MDQILDVLLMFSGPAPYFIIFGILLACGLGLPIPEDITLFAAGMSAYYGLTNLSLIVLISYFGVMLGDWLIFLLGQKYGKILPEKKFFKKILNPQRLQMVQEQLQQRGNYAIFFARFMPGVRAALFFCAGMLKIPTVTFLFWDGLAALLSVPAITALTYYSGDQVDKVIRKIQGFQHGIVICIVIVILFFFIKSLLRRSKASRS